MRLRNDMIFKIFFICLLLFFTGCDKKKNRYNLKTKNVKIDTNTIILKGVDFYNTKSGKTSWNLTADKAKIFKNKQVAELTNVRLDFKNQNFEALSKKGFYNLKTKDGKLYDKVILKGQDWKILSEAASFHSNDRTIVIEKSFKFSGRNFSLRGKKMTAYIDKKKIIIKGRVVSVWKKN